MPLTPPNIADEYGRAGEPREVALDALDARQRRLVENARVAAQRGELDYALEATAQVLRQAPGCFAVRRLRWTMQRRRTREARGTFFARVASAASTAPFVFGRANKSAQDVLAMAERVLEKHPENVTALILLADAARRLGWRETVAFALEAANEIEPDNREHVLAWGEALLAVERPAEALRVADAWLREHPADGAVQDLMRKASIAETLAQGRWEADGTFRGKLRADVAGAKHS